MSSPTPITGSMKLASPAPKDISTAAVGSTIRLSVDGEAEDRYFLLTEPPVSQANGTVILMMRQTGQKIPQRFVYCVGGHVFVRP